MVRLWVMGCGAAVFCPCELHEAGTDFLCLLVFSITGILISSLKLLQLVNIPSICLVPQKPLAV